MSRFNTPQHDGMFRHGPNHRELAPHRRLSSIRGERSGACALSRMHGGEAVSAWPHIEALPSPLAQWTHHVRRGESGAWEHAQGSPARSGGFRRPASAGDGGVSWRRQPRAQCFVEPALGHPSGQHRRHGCSRHAFCATGHAGRSAPQFAPDSGRCDLHQGAAGSMGPVGRVGSPLWRFTSNDPSSASWDHLGAYVVGDMWVLA